MAQTKVSLIKDGVIVVGHLHTNHGITTGHIGEGANLYFTDARVMTSLGSVSTHIIPDADITYDLGSATNRFRDLYLSGNTIHLGGNTKISVNNDGEVEFKDSLDAPKRLKVRELDFVDDQGRNKRFKIDATSGRLATFDAVGTLTADKLDLSAMSTTDLAEGSNLYYTDARVGTYLTTNNYATQSYVQSQVSGLVASAPSTLDTLNELAAALGDDPNFATTVSTQIGGKLSSSDSRIANWDTAYGWGNHASAGYLTSVSWGSVTGKPSTFPPSSHTHAWSEITGKPSTFTPSAHNHDDRYYTESESDARFALAHSHPYLSDNSDSEQTIGSRINYFNVGGLRMNMDPRWNEGGYDGDNGNLHIWSTRADGGNYGRAGIALYNGSAYQYLTTKGGQNALYHNNSQIITAATIGSQSVNYANSAGTVSGTQLGATSQSYTTIASGGWALPTGSSVFSKADSVGGVGDDGYWYVLGRRDVGGGYSGIYSPHSNGTAWLGMSLTSSANPTWYKLWTSGNDGSGSGLDADLLDGQHASSFASASHNHDGRYVKEGGTSFSGEYPVVVRTASDVVYSDANIKFRGSDSRLTVDGSITTPQLNGDVTVTGNVVTNGHFYGRSVNGQYSNLYRMGGVYFTWDSDSYGTNLNHSITSTYGDTYGDHLTINSYGHVRINIDSNGNGSNTFSVGRHTTGSANALMTVTEGGNLTMSGDIYAGSGKAFYQSGNTTYYLYPTSTSSLSKIWCKGSGTNSAPRWDTSFHVAQSQHWYGHSSSQTMYAGESGNDVLIRGQAAIGGTAIQSGYALTMSGSVDLNANEINYVGQLHFQDNVRFFDDGNDNYLNFKWGDTNSGGIKFYDGNTTLHGYVYGDNSGFGLLDNDAHWSIRIPFGGSGMELRSNNNVELTINDNHTISHGSSRAPIFYDSNNTSYYTNPASTSRMNQIDANYLDVVSGAAYALRFWGGSHNYSIRMSQSSDGTYGGRVSGETTSDYNMYFTMASGTNRGFVFNNGLNNAIAGIDASGIGRFTGAVKTPFVEINKTSTYGTGLDLTFSGSSSTGMLIRNNTGSTKAAVSFYYSSAPQGARGTIMVSSTSTAYNTSSDYRLKENLVEITDGIERVKLLQPKRFNFIGDDVTVDGFVAHETQEVVPESITGVKDEVDEEGNPVYQGIDQAKLVPLLTAALQEAIAKIDDLESRLQAIENQ